MVLPFRLFLFLNSLAILHCGTQIQVTNVTYMLLVNLFWTEQINVSSLISHLVLLNKYSQNTAVLLVRLEC